MLPQDPIILLSYVNTQLRDRDASLAAFCDRENADEADLRAAVCRKWVIFTMPRRTVSSDFVAGLHPGVIEERKLKYPL